MVFAVLMQIRVRLSSLYQPHRQPIHVIYTKSGDFFTSIYLNELHIRIHHQNGVTAPDCGSNLLILEILPQECLRQLHGKTFINKQYRRRYIVIFLNSFHQPGTTYNCQHKQYVLKVQSRTFQKSH
jgi:hypothetical protein